MLDVSLDRVSYTRGDFALQELTALFPRSAHTAVVGRGSSTLLELIAGRLRPDSGTISIGSRVVNDLRPARRPLLYVTAEPAVPRWWSVRHVLVAAVRRRTLDRVDRQREFDLAASRWQLDTLLERRASTLSSTEKALLNLARIDLLHPALVVADRLLESIAPSLRTWAADEIDRTVRVSGATWIAAPASHLETGLADRLLVLEKGRIVQFSAPPQVYAHPASEEAARLTGAINVVPVSIRGTTIDSVIGSWEVPSPAFQGTGVALIRPEDFAVARPGEESDFIFGVEEAVFDGGLWRARGLLSGGVSLQLFLPQRDGVHKGKLLPIRFDPERLTLLERELTLPQTSASKDLIPPMRETR